MNPLLLSAQKKASETKNPNSLNMPTTSLLARSSDGFFAGILQKNLDNAFRPSLTSSSNNSLTGNISQHNSQKNNAPISWAMDYQNRNNASKPNNAHQNDRSVYFQQASYQSGPNDTSAYQQMSPKESKKESEYNPSITNRPDNKSDEYSAQKINQESSDQNDLHEIDNKVAKDAAKQMDDISQQIAQLVDLIKKLEASGSLGEDSQKMRISDVSSNANKMNADIENIKKQLNQILKSLQSFLNNTANKEIDPVLAQDLQKQLLSLNDKVQKLLSGKNISQNELQSLRDSLRSIQEWTSNHSNLSVKSNAATDTLLDANQKDWSSAVKQRSQGENARDSLMDPKNSQIKPDAKLSAGADAEQQGVMRHTAAALEKGSWIRESKSNAAKNNANAAVSIENMNQKNLESAQALTALSGMNSDETLSFEKRGRGAEDNYLRNLSTLNAKNMLGQAAKSTGSLANMTNVEMRQVIDQLIQQARLAQNAPGQFRFSANLKPEWLGHVSFHLDYDKGAMLGKFFVNNDQAKELLQQHLQDLRRELLNMGFDIEKFEVALKERNDEGNFAQLQSDENDSSLGNENDGSLNGSNEDDNEFNESDDFYGWNRNAMNQKTAFDMRV